MSDPHDHEPAAFDALLGNAEVHVEAGNPAIEVTVAVPVSAATLAALTEPTIRAPGSGSGPGRSYCDWR